MKNSQNKKKIQISLLVLIAVLTLSIGYASITAVNLIINGNGTASVSQENFKVYFTNSTITEGMGTSSIDENDKTIAYFDIAGLHKSGDYAEAVYTVLNASNSIGADISLQLTNSNNDYFKVTETVADSELQAGESTTVTVKVEMIKTPLDTDVSTCISAMLIANPINNSQATGNDPASKVKPSSQFDADSWDLISYNIRNNNTDQYNIGDTKTIDINGEQYTVRLANKSVNDKCSNSSYSETACGFVVEFVDIITTMKMNNTRTHKGGYPKTLVYNYLNNELIELFPSDLYNVLLNTRVISSHGNVSGDYNNFTTYNKIYLLSQYEIFGKRDSELTDNTFQLDYYRTNNQNGIANYCVKMYDNEKENWWLRSAYSGANGSFGSVRTYGRVFFANSEDDCGVSPAFRIG